MRERGEKLVGISRAIDAATIGGALVVGMVYPPLIPIATEAIMLSTATLAGAEIVGSELKRR